MVDKKNRFVVIVGCGRLGSYIADTLSGDEFSVVVIDLRPEAFEGLSTAFSGFRIEGDATEYAVLQEAKVKKADILAAVTDNDNINLLVAQMAKAVFGVKTVLARIYEKDREALCGRMDIETICPSRILGDLFLKAIRKPDPLRG